MYDVWGEFPELAGAEGQRLPGLAELRSLPAWPGDPREVSNRPWGGSCWRPLVSPFLHSLLLANWLLAEACGWAGA